MQLRNEMRKRKLEFKFWSDGIDRVLLGYLETEFSDRFMDFVEDLNKPETDLSNLATFEKEVIHSIPLQLNDLSLKWRNYMQDYLLK
jgi:hypothetical protein